MSTTDSLSFVPAFKLIAIITLLIGGLVGLMFFLNTRRNEAIVNSYTQEAQGYIASNQDGINYLFTTLFYKGMACHIGPYGQVTSTCYTLVRSELYEHVTSDLKDFSSTFFARYANDKVQTLSLDGTTVDQGYSGSNTTEKQQKLRSLLKGEVNSIPWDDYFYNMSGKEVVIPVDYEGKRIGAIVRRVIE
jgi:hypothetical protein